MKTIDWEQRKYEIVKEILPSLLKNQERVDVYSAVKFAVACANFLIEKLKDK